jgi:hypothetical protein
MKKIVLTWRDRNAPLNSWPPKSMNFFIKTSNCNSESKIEFHSRIFDVWKALNGSENKLKSQHHKSDLQTATTFYCSHWELHLMFWWASLQQCNKLFWWKGILTFSFVAFLTEGSTRVFWWGFYEFLICGYLPCFVERGLLFLTV